MMPQPDSPQSGTAVDLNAALVAHVRGLLPSIKEMEALTVEQGLGPDVTMPAVYAHLLLTGFDHARLAAEHAEIIPTPLKMLVQRFREAEPGMPLTDDEQATLAGEMAEMTLMFAARPTAALLVLLQAAGSIALSRLPANLAVSAFEQTTSFALSRLREVVGVGETRQ